MEYAREYGEFERRGSQIAAVSVDPPQRNAAMVEKLLLPFPLLSDPAGAVLRAYDAWDEANKIAIPSIFVLDRSGTIRYLYRGRDFADRPGDEALFAALDEAERTPETAPSGAEIHVTAAEAEQHRSSREGISLQALLPYYRGVYYATVAIKGRLAAYGPECREGVRDVGRFQAMMQGYSKALQETIDMETRGATSQR